jgi:hypothetical protein
LGFSRLKREPNSEDHNIRIEGQESSVRDWGKREREREGKLSKERLMDRGE